MSQDAASTFRASFRDRLKGTVEYEADAFCLMGFEVFDDPLIDLQHNLIRVLSLLQDAGLDDSALLGLLFFRIDDLQLQKSSISLDYKTLFPS